MHAREAAASGQESGVKFQVIGEIEAIETIAAGIGVRVRSSLRKLYGKGR